MSKNELQGDPEKWQASMDLRNWVWHALEAAGAKFDGSAGVCEDYGDINMEIDGVKVGIRVTPKAAS